MTSTSTRDGWRLTGAAWHPDRGLKLAGVDLDPHGGSFGAFEAAECRADRYPTEHRTHADDPAPADGCSCGWHYVADLADLVRWGDFAHRQAPAGAELPAELAGAVRFWTIVTVTATGRVLPSSSASDPPGTFRADLLRLTGGVVLDRGAAPEPVAELLRDAGMVVAVADDLASL